MIRGQTNREILRFPLRVPLITGCTLFVERKFVETSQGARRMFPMSAFNKVDRSLTERDRQLAESNFARNFGWFIEYENRIIGELEDCRPIEMFWDSYAVKPAEPPLAQLLFDDNLWKQCKLRFRNRVLEEYCDSAFCGGSPPFIRDGRISMRGLYLLPDSKTL